MEFMVKNKLLHNLRIRSTEFLGMTFDLKSIAGGNDTLRHAIPIPPAVKDDTLGELELFLLVPCSY